jgi:two-component sensor histidine kinase
MSRQQQVTVEFDPQVRLLHQAVLLYELNHRINNEYASAISAVSLAAAHSCNEEVVNELLHSDVHRALQMPEADGLVDAATYLRRLCLSISRSKLNHLEIHLVLAACPLLLRSDRCWRLGMIVYELITNAARRAFSDGKREIRVALLRAGSYATCKVQDNGSPPKSVVPGRGLKIVHELVKTLNGNLKHQFGSHGSISLLAFPYSDGAQKRRQPGECKRI